MEEHHVAVLLYKSQTAYIIIICNLWYRSAHDLLMRQYRKMETEELTKLQLTVSLKMLSSLSSVALDRKDFQKKV